MSLCTQWVMLDNGWVSSGHSPAQAEGKAWPVQSWVPGSGYLGCLVATFYAVYRERGSGEGGVKAVGSHLKFQSSPYPRPNKFSRSRQGSYWLYCSLHTPHFAFIHTTLA